MRQPPPSGEDCTGTMQIDLPQPDPPELPSSDYHAAGWMILAVFAAIIVFDIIALKMKKRTISQTVQKVSRMRRLFRGLMAAGIVILTWHVLLGFPGR